MPLVQVDLPRALFDQKAVEIGRELQAAFVEAACVPPNDKFQIFRPRDAGEIVFDPTYDEVDRRDLMIIQILMVHHYPVDQKRALYANMVNRLVEIGIRKEDILIAVTENGFEDWYAGQLYGK
ncbi:tautomerase family protein [Telmatospirillum sp.]|uniref:tautomerase family protein n=1 Tax=Telmatospirillum sp. TaxID=2079197 RepID=UPI002843CEFF|nr:tautomerase family protein [Telmatospirillum sp.]MDR3439295.1 tautomerase family protein [Telmatospirillum sp.]